MASHWLDIARYSTVTVIRLIGTGLYGLGRLGRKAFNDNKPYSEFITEQIAGDMLPNATDDQIQATTFLNCIRKKWKVAVQRGVSCRVCGR